MINIISYISNKNKKAIRYNKSIDFFSINNTSDFTETNRPAIVKYNGILIALNIQLICG